MWRSHELLASLSMLLDFRPGILECGVKTKRIIKFHFGYKGSQESIRLLFKKKKKNNKYSRSPSRALVQSHTTQNKAAFVRHTGKILLTYFYNVEKEKKKIS